VAQFLEAMPARGGPALVAVTNDPGSPLARAGRPALPLSAGQEQWIASKTYLNSLALLWLAVRRWGGAGGRAEDLDRLERLADLAGQRLAGAGTAAERLGEALDAADPLLFTGHGPHAFSARQAAMVLSEWPKRPALHAGLAAFRHGFIEATRPGMGAAIFASPGRTQASARRLAAELRESGARAALIAGGQVFSPDEPLPEPVEADEYLAPVLDILPVQVYADALAKTLGLQPGFRHIAKVVRKL
jgi:glucosamine--fructose-6-phosphate aminotransferase (isomerizing)